MGNRCAGEWGDQVTGGNTLREIRAQVGKVSDMTGGVNNWGKKHTQKRKKTKKKTTGVIKIAPLQLTESCLGGSVFSTYTFTNSF